MSFLPLQPITTQHTATIIQQAIEWVLSSHREELIPVGVDVIRYHMTLGRHLRNHFGLWVPEKPLHEAIKATTGITHPDDMSHWLLEEAQKQARKQCSKTPG